MECGERVGIEVEEGEEDAEGVEGVGEEAEDADAERTWGEEEDAVADHLRDAIHSAQAVARAEASDAEAYGPRHYILKPRALYIRI